MSKFWLWEGDYSADDEPISKCIQGNPASFADAAGMLLEWANSFPGSNLIDQLEGNLTIPDDQYARRDGIVQIARQLMNIALGCGEDVGAMFQLRNDPENGCIVQQSLDGGETWTTAFDFASCGLTTSTNYATNYTYIRNYINDADEFVTNLFNQYDGDVTNIYPQAEYDVGDTEENDFRNIALCYALYRAVTVVCEGVIGAIDEAESNTALGIAAVAAGVGLFVLFTVATGGLGLPAAIAAYGSLGVGATSLVIGSIGAGGAIATWMNAAIAAGNKAAYEDMAARQEVACKLYDMLANVTLSESVYADALNDHGLSGAAGVIADAMDGFNAIPENFAGFANLVNQAYAAAAVGIITDDDCACEEPPTPITNITYLTVTPAGGTNLTHEGGFIWRIDSTTNTGVDERITIMHVDGELFQFGSMAVYAPTLIGNAFAAIVYHDPDDTQVYIPGTAAMPLNTPMRAVVMTLALGTPFTIEFSFLSAE